MYYPLKQILFMVSIAFSIASCQESKTAQQAKDIHKPNIVFLYTDDQTFASIHALGNEEIYTPNLDRMAKAGTSFTHAYNMGGWHGAICVASRSMIISGSFLWNAKEKERLWSAKDSMALQETWPKLMEKEGYDTYMTGKWHVQAPADVIFSETKHIRPGMPPDRRGELSAVFKKWETESGDMTYWNDYLPMEYARPRDENDTEWLPTDSLQGGFWEGGTHWSEVVRNDALDFIDRSKTKENPFFMYLAFNAPHDPRQAPQRFLDMYPVDSIKVPDSFLPEYPFKDAIGNQATLRDEALAPYPRTEYAIKKHRQEYYALISHLDEQIGSILDALEDAGKMDNTYIFFASDHGLSVGHHGLLGKQSLFDHSVRVPLIVMGPDVPANQQLPQDVYLQDIMATSLELAGAEKPVYLQFNSFMDVVSGDNTKGHYKNVYGAYMNLQRMIRQEDYKLIVYPKIDKVLLFDMKTDPNELTDLATLPKHKEKVNNLFKELMELQKTMNDSLDLSPTYTKVVGDFKECYLENVGSSVCYHRSRIVHNKAQGIPYPISTWVSSYRRKDKALELSFPTLSCHSEARGIPTQQYTSFLLSSEGQNVEVVIPHPVLSFRGTRNPYPAVRKFPPIVGRTKRWSCHSPPCPVIPRHEESPSQSVRGFPPIVGRTKRWSCHSEARGIPFPISTWVSSYRRKDKTLALSFRGTRNPYPISTWVSSYRRKDKTLALSFRGTRNPYPAVREFPPIVVRTKRWSCHSEARGIPNTAPVNT
ncbi:sulfatase-like hydrolase/transferase [Maribacter chungangensis]|uniref:Sulfatase-like hydrolase/transferase n=1 Tax=Maribacter chungangensis TaxID=1069117 RepID=A0ABW3B2D8_9FLAO